MRNIILMLSVLLLGACDASYVPKSKAARYDPISGKLVMPHPCPDWSQPQTTNYGNQTHSNFGCATNTNTAAQLAYPQDLLEGHGDDAPDTNITTKVVEDYRAGKLPIPFAPVQTGTVAQ